jgi:thiamine biosynthesis lipoprotein
MLGILRHRSPPAKSYAFHYEDVLGTSFELQVVATHPDAAQTAEAGVLAEVDRLDRILSGYSPTSELAKWQATHGVDVPVSRELADVLEAAEDWREWTGGAFNASAVSLLELPDGASSETGVSDRLREMDEPLWTVDRAAGAACRHTHLPVSLDALAKGYIVDRAAACARAISGVTQVLVNIGGDLRHHGTQALSVAITDPRAPAENAPPIAVVKLREEALATSGGCRRSVAMAGRTGSHIIDPRGGRAAEHVMSASVIARDCAEADALSTAFSVLAPEESVALSDSLAGVGCLVVREDGTTTTNAEWRAHAAA